MILGIVIYSEDPETVWNAFRFGNFALKKGDNTKVFLMGKAVECESLNTDKFKVTEQIRSFMTTVARHSLAALASKSGIPKAQKPVRCQLWKTYIG